MEPIHDLAYLQKGPENPMAFCVAGCRLSLRDPVAGSGGWIKRNPTERCRESLKDARYRRTAGFRFLITAAVHLDAVPGVRQDWLIRPIRRRDLMLAKLLFAALAVQAPILVANTAAFLISGFSLRPFVRVVRLHRVSIRFSNISQRTNGTRTGSAAASTRPSQGSF
jgi:hypothetical protein